MTAPMTSEDRGEDLGAALRTEFRGERLGERREARDVGEQAGALDAVRHRGSARERPAAIARDVGLGVVVGQVGVGGGRSRLGHVHAPPVTAPPFCATGRVGPCAAPGARTIRAVMEPPRRPAGPRLPALVRGRSAGRRARRGLDHLGFDRARVPRRRRRRDRRQRRARPRRDRAGHGRAGRPPRLRARQCLHHGTGRGVRGPGRPSPADGRPRDLPGLGRLRGDRDRAQAGPCLPPRPGRAGSLDRLCPMGELPRQHPRGPGPVGPPAPAPAIRGLARPVPPRLGRLSVPGRPAREPTRSARPMRSPRNSTPRSGPPSPGPWRRSSPSRSSGPRSRRPSRPTATGRPSPTSAAGTACC